MLGYGFFILITIGAKVKKSGIIVKYFLFLVVIVLSAFFFFEPDDLFNGQEMAQELLEELGPSDSNLKVIPKGANYDFFNIMSFVIYSLFAWDLLRENSFLNRVLSVGLGLLEPKKTKYILLATSVLSLLFLGTTLYSIQNNLPNYFGTVEWVVVSSSRSINGQRHSMNAWSSGQTFVLNEVAKVACYYALYKFSNKLRQKLRNVDVVGPSL